MRSIQFGDDFDVYDSIIVYHLTIDTETNLEQLHEFYMNDFWDYFRVVVVAYFIDNVPNQNLMTLELTIRLKMHSIFSSKL